MGIIKAKLLFFFQALKFIMSFMAFVYFSGWIVQIYSDNFFEKLNGFLGLLPNYFDEIIYMEAIINQKAVTMGYVYSALLMILAALIAMFCVRVLSFEKAENNDKNEISKKENEIILTEKKVTHTEIKNEEQEEKLDCFCALFEFILKPVDENQKNYNDIKKLKNEYSKIIKRKLSEKYSSNLKFAIADRVFLVCNDFSLLNSIVVDILRLYKVISNIDNQKLIKTDYLFSFYASLDRKNIKENLKILYKINEYKNINRVIVNHDIYMQYWDLEEKIFDFKPMESVKLSNINSKNEDLEVDLYYIKNII